jgi:hypothetical protein
MIVSGNREPSLPNLERACGYGGFPLTAAIVHDWYDRAAARLATSGATDLERVLSAIVAEKGETRSDYFKPRGVQPFEVSPLFQWIGQIGTLEEGSFLDLLTKLQISADTLLGRYVAAVWKYGSIPQALVELAHDSRMREAMERACADSAELDPADPDAGLKELFVLKRAVPTGDDAKVARAVFPGASRQEISCALTSRGSPLVDWTAQTLAKLRADGVTEEELVLALHPLIPSERRSPRLVRQALEQRTWSPLTAPGILAALAAQGLDEVDRVRSEARAACVRELELCQANPSALAVELKLWGLKTSDIGLAKSGSFTLVRQSDDPGFVSDTSSIGIKRAGEALKRISYTRTKLSPRDTFGVAEIVTAGSSRAINDALA